MTKSRHVPVDRNSKLVIEDNKSNDTFAARKIYERIPAPQWDQPDQSRFVSERTPFRPASTDSAYSFTAARVLKPVFNVYQQAPSKPKIFGYFTDWSQYDKRLDPKKVEGLPNEPVLLQDKWGGPETGRGYDLGQVDPRAYDKIVFGFLGIVGDDGEKGHVVNAAGALLGKQRDEATFIDWWGDIATWERNGFTEKPSWTIDPSTVKGVFNQKAIEADKGWGLLGGLYFLQKKAREQGHKLELAFSIGGWTMSKPFYGIAADPARRRVFVNSVVSIFKDFPMFSEVDCDWEFPGGGGNDEGLGSPQDGANYKHLIAELRAALDGAFGAGNKRISIACSGVIKKMQDSRIPELFDAGLDNVNVMTYDFFGTPWAATLGHQTNLKNYGNPSQIEQFGSEISIVAAVDHLLKMGVDASKISVGWAGYTRNAKGARIESFSPLRGSYDNTYRDHVVGTFESGTTEYNDVLYNYLDLENKQGRNGFELYTDDIADADFLYNQDSRIFLSLDTPRAVRDKGLYAATKGLGGFFTWTVDQDKGVLVNAAREGCGYQLAAGGQRIDMRPLYFKGINSHGEPNLAVRISPEQWSLREGGAVTLHAKVDPVHSGLRYQWQLPAGLHALNGIGTSALEFGTLPGLRQTQSFTVGLTVTDAVGKAYHAQAHGTVTPTQPEVPLEHAMIVPADGLRIKVGEPAKLSLVYSPPDGIVEFAWRLPTGLTPSGPLTQKAVRFTADSGVAQSIDFDVVLRALDRQGREHLFHSTVTVLDDNQVETPSVWIDPTEATLRAGDDGQLEAATSGIAGALAYQWQRLPFGLKALGSLSAKVLAFSASADINEANQFKVHVSVTEGNGEMHNASAVVKVLPKEKPEQPERLDIVPPSLQVSHGKQYRLTAEFSGTAHIQAYSWYLPPELKYTSSGKTVEFEVKSPLRSGATLIVRAEANDAAGRKYAASATVTLVGHDIPEPIEDLKLRIEPPDPICNAATASQAMAVIGKAGADFNAFVFEWIVPPGLTMTQHTGPVLAYQTPKVLAQETTYILKVLAKDAASGQVKGEAATAITVRPGETDHGEAPAWEPGKSYPRETRVTHRGAVWLAQWWANPGDEPGEATAQYGGPTPWQRA